MKNIGFNFLIPVFSGERRQSFSSQLNLETSHLTMLIGGNDKYIYPPIIIKNKLYLMDISGLFQEYNLSNGELIQKLKFHNLSFIRDKGVLANDRFIILSNSLNELVFIDIIDINIIYKMPFCPVDLKHAVVENDDLYLIGIDSGKNYCFRISISGRLVKWKKEVPFFPHSYLLLSGEVLVLMKGKIGFWAFSAEYGNLIWDYTLNIPGDIITSTCEVLVFEIINIPKILNNQVLFSVLGGYLISIDIHSGVELYRVKHSINHSLSFGINLDNEIVVLGKGKYIKTDNEGKNLKEVPFNYSEVGQSVDGLWGEPCFIKQGIIAADILRKKIILIHENGNLNILAETLHQIPKENVVIPLESKVLVVDIKGNIYSIE